MCNQLHKCHHFDIVVRNLYDMDSNAHKMYPHIDLCNCKQNKKKTKHSKLVKLLVFICSYKIFFYVINVYSIKVQLLLFFYNYKSGEWRTYQNVCCRYLFDVTRTLRFFISFIKQKNKYNFDWFFYTDSLRLKFMT